MCYNRSAEQGEDREPTGEADRQAKQTDRQNGSEPPCGERRFPDKNPDGAVRRRRMRTKMKIELILLIYDTLLGGRPVARRKFCRAHRISERTFYRYLQELDAFLEKHKPECRIVVDDPVGKYYLEKS